MKFLLDTHILLWWYLDDPKIPRQYLRMMEEAEKNGEELGLSIISLWEIAKLISIGRLIFDVTLDKWFEELESDPLLNILPLNRQIILESIRLGASFPKDPADQMIAATSRYHELKLLSCDEKILKSGVVALA